jgi:hypothetical protein
MGDGAYGRADIGGGISFELPARRFQDGVQLEVLRHCVWWAWAMIADEPVVVEGDTGRYIRAAVKKERC